MCEIDTYTEGQCDISELRALTVDQLVDRLTRSEQHVRRLARERRRLLEQIADLVESLERVSLTSIIYQTRDGQSHARAGHGS